MEDEIAERQKSIQFIMDQEIGDGESLAAEARKLIYFLLVEKKGYLPGDIEKKTLFDVHLGQETVSSSVDFVVSVSGVKAMIIKCSSGSLSSRERQAVAAARLIGSSIVPLAVVADPVNAEVLDVATGEVIGEGFGAIPVKEQLVQMLADRSPIQYSPERLEKEKRILLAFDAIQCCVPQGGGGGVSLKKPGQ